MLRRRLEDRIKDLSKQLAEARGDEFQTIAAELQAALAEHNRRLRDRLKKYPFVPEDRPFEK
jgi:hypothetical protein